MLYAVIDTNVLVASPPTKRHDSPTVRIMDAVYSGMVVPLLDGEMSAEYREVLHRKKFGLDQAKCDFVVSLVTGNQRHYPKADFVVSPAQFCELAVL